MGNGEGAGEVEVCLLPTGCIFGWDSWLANYISSRGAVAHMVDTTPDLLFLLFGNVSGQGSREETWTSFFVCVQWESLPRNPAV